MVLGKNKKTLVGEGEKKVIQPPSFSPLLSKNSPGAPAPKAQSALKSAVFKSKIPTAVAIDCNESDIIGEVPEFPLGEGEDDGEEFSYTGPTTFNAQPAAPGAGVDKTASLERGMVSVDLLDPDEHNPNEMGEQEFNLLYSNMEEVGFTEPVLIRYNLKAPGRYKIVGGHHRVEVAKLQGYEEVPYTLITDPDFDEDRAKFQMVRQNIIHGKMNPKKFTLLYDSLHGKYAEEIAGELFGFANEDEFKKMIAATAKSLPPEMKEQFKAASKELKTIDDLAGLLNRMFNDYGDTMPYGYMIFDFGGQDNVWLRLKKNQKEDLLALGEFCKQHNRSMDAVMASVLQLIAENGEVQSALVEVIHTHPEMVIPEETVLPSEDFLAMLDK